MEELVAWRGFVGGAGGSTLVGGARHGEIAIQTWMEEFECFRTGGREKTSGGLERLGDELERRGGSGKTSIGW